MKPDNLPSAIRNFLIVFVLTLLMMAMSGCLSSSDSRTSDDPIQENPDEEIMEEDPGFSGSSFYHDIKAFNQDIGSWDVREIQSIESIFENAASFSQDLPYWCLESLDLPEIRDDYGPESFDEGATSWEDHNKPSRDDETSGFATDS